MTELLPLNIAHLPVKLRLEDYLLLGESGAFQAYRKTELIDGEIYYMNAQHRPHALLKSRLHVILAQLLREVGGLEAIVEGSIAIPPHNSPEPDIVVTDEPEGRGLIPLASVKLIIEVSDATLGFDLNRKAALYAAAGVPEYWVFDITDRIVHQMWEPAADGFGQRCETRLGEPLSAATLSALTVPTANL